MPKGFWKVYGYVARQWYDVEYGAVEPRDRWYHHAMIFLEARSEAHAPIR